jgi:hypothetical protein
MKRCNKCEEVKENNEFQIRDGKPVGHCKKCNSEKSKAKYQRNREKRLEALKEKRQTDESFREKCNENSKKYGAMFRKNNPEYAKEYLQKIKGSSQYLKYLEKAKLRSREIEATPELKARRKQLSREYKKSEIGAFRATLQNNLKGALNSRLIKNLGFKAYSINARLIFNRIGAKPSTEHGLDHIIPLSMFELSNPVHVGLAYSPVNLRWLTRKENTEKGSTIKYSEISRSEELLKIATFLGILEEHDGLDVKAFREVAY